MNYTGSSFFDIGECVGSLEYFAKEFVQQAVTEFARIMKSNGRFVLDIPNIGSPEFEIAKLIEEYLGRQDFISASHWTDGTGRNEQQCC